MKLYEDVKVDFEHEDERGKLVQLVHQGCEQINVLYTKSGVIRGNHYHKRAKEYFYVVSGSVRVSLVKESDMAEKIFRKGDFFCIFPYVNHEMNFEEDTVMVAMYDVPVENADGTKDIYS